MNSTKGLNKMKKFKDLKKGDFIFLIDEKNDFKIEKLEIKSQEKNCSSSYYVTLKTSSYARYSLHGDWSREGLICTEEKVATDFVEKVIKKKKLFATLKPGDNIYIANKNEESYGTVAVANVIGNKLIIDSKSENTAKLEINLYDKHSLYSDSCSVDIWRLRAYKWGKNSWCERIFVNEEGVKSYLRKIKERREKKAIDKYVDNISNHGKPISLVDNKGNKLCCGDKVAYVRRNGLHAHTDISFGIVTGENKTKIKILDEEELKIGKPNVDWWNREEGPFIKSDGIHALEPQNVVLISSGSENKLIQFGNKSID
jgi:hypothetical protein